MSNKEIHKFLGRESKKLLPEYYNSYHPTAEEIDGVKFIVKKPYMNLVNHHRRLYRIWKRTKSLEEVNKYFLQRGFELKTGILPEDRKVFE